MKLVVRPEAELDVLESSIWYDEASLGLGDVFIDAVRSVYSRIEEGPLYYQKRYRDVRLAQTRRFQHGVYYVVRKDGTVVLAVLHLHRDPSTWKQRFEDLHGEGAG